MAKSPTREALEKAYPNPASDWLQPDNHDKVNIALGLVSADAAENLTFALQNVWGGLDLLGQRMKDTLEQQSKIMIESNEKVAKSNEHYARAMMFLTGGLVFVGLLQVAALIWQTLHH